MEKVVHGQLDTLAIKSQGKVVTITAVVHLGVEARNF